MRGLIIVPAFNEADVITSTLQKLNQRPKGWDVLVVNDGSSDKTSELAHQSDARVLDLPVNLGIGGAVQAGYRVARREDYDYALQFDADGQHLVDEIPKLMDVMPGPACVIGSRYLNGGGQTTPLRRVGAIYFSWLLKLLGAGETTDPTSGFRLCDRRGTALFASRYPSDYPEVEARLLLSRRQLPCNEVAVNMAPRAAGKSSIGGLDSLFYVFKVTLSLFMGGGR